MFGFSPALGYRPEITQEQLDGYVVKLFLEEFSADVGGELHKKLVSDIDGHELFDYLAEKLGGAESLKVEDQLVLHLGGETHRLDLYEVQTKIANRLRRERVIY